MSVRDALPLAVHVETRSCSVGLNIQFLGGFSVQINSQSIAATAWQRLDAKRLFIFLVLNHSHRASRAELCKSLWPSVEKNSARARLTNTLYSLRKALTGAGDRLTADAENIALKWDSAVIWDVEVYERCLDAAAVCVDVEEQLEQLECALSLYRGDLLQEFVGEIYTQQDRALLKARYLWLLDQLVLLHSPHGANTGKGVAEAIRYQKMRIEAHLLDQDAHAKLLELTLLAGDLEGAIVHYKYCRDIIASEFGQAPSADVQSLYEQIKAQRKIALVKPALEIALLAGAGIQHDTCGADLIDFAATGRVLNPLLDLHRASAQADFEATNAPAPMAATFEATRIDRAPIARIAQVELSVEDAPDLRLDIDIRDPSFTPLGRDNDVHEIFRLLCDSPECARVLTIAGFGGVGKTTIARHLLHRWRATDTFAWNQVSIAVFVDCRELNTVQAVAEKLKSVLGLRQSLTEGLRTLGGDSHGLIEGLLVIDNCEHLVNQAGILLTLAQRCPKLRVLTTSRCALRIEGELVYPLQPLNVATDAVTLFVRRARMRNPKLRFDASALAAVAGICRKLDGLPLAIELAAARTRLFTPESLLERLQKDLTLLHGNVTDGTTASTGPHRSLWGILDWTVKLLSIRERELLVWLPVFQGGFSLAVVEAIFAYRSTGKVASEVVDLFEALIDHQLICEVNANGERSSEASESVAQNPHSGLYEDLSAQSALSQSSPGRRWMLLETVKQFVDATLSDKSDPEYCAADAHAAYFIRQMNTLMNANEDSEACSLFFIEEPANLLAGLDWKFSQNSTQPIDDLLRTLNRIADSGTHWLQIDRWIERINQDSSLALNENQRDLISVISLTNLQRGRQLEPASKFAEQILDQFFIDGVVSQKNLRAALIQCEWLMYEEGRPEESIAIADRVLEAARLKNMTMQETGFLLGHRLFALVWSGHQATLSDVMKKRGATLRSVPAFAFHLRMNDGWVEHCRGNADKSISIFTQCCKSTYAREDIIQRRNAHSALIFISADWDRFGTMIVQAEKLEAIKGLPPAVARETSLIASAARRYVECRILAGEEQENAWRKFGELLEPIRFASCRPQLLYLFLDAAFICKNKNAMRLALIAILEKPILTSVFRTVSFSEVTGLIATILALPKLATEALLLAQEWRKRNSYVPTLRQRGQRRLLRLPDQILDTGASCDSLDISQFSGIAYWKRIHPILEKLSEELNLQTSP